MSSYHSYKEKAMVSPESSSLSPVWSSPLPVFVYIEKQLWGVNRWGGAGIQKQLFMLGEVLGRVLFSQPCAVEELALQQGQVGLQEHDRYERMHLVCFTNADRVCNSTKQKCHWIYATGLIPRHNSQDWAAMWVFSCTWIAPSRRCKPPL